MRTLWILGVFALSLMAADEPAYRAVVYDVTSLPELRVVMDVRGADNTASPRLAPRDFRLLEDSNRTASAERVKEFRETDLGVALVVLLDASPSMKGRPLDAIRRGLAQLVSRKRDQDRVAVLSFANDFRWEATWDASSESLQAAFRDLHTRGNRTRLYDAVDEAFKAFDDQARNDENFPLRRSILVLSDGHDEGSTLTLQEQIRRLAESRVRLDAVALSRSPAWLKSLQSLAYAGFGSFRSADTPEGLTGLLERGLETLLKSPVLEFQAQNFRADGRSHEAGIEHTPSGWRDTRTVDMPDYLFYKDRRVWFGVGIAILALIIVVAVSRFSRKQQPAVVRNPPPPAPSMPASPVPARDSQSASTKPRPAAPVQRTATLAEPADYYRTPTVHPPPSVYPSTAPPPAAVKQARAATVLAPQASEHMFLNAISGPLSGQRIEVPAADFWIGSAPNNQLCLEVDPAVSGNHACIRTEGTVRRIYDNGSMNNTWVNGNAVGTSTALLHPGDHIVIGNSEFIFQS